MNASEASDLIEKAGGTSAFGRLLGMDGQPRWQQRVDNWRRRGIPPGVILDNYETIRRLRESKRRPAKGARAVNGQRGSRHGNRVTA